MKYKVKFGYGQNDYVRIDALEVPRAIKAQVTGKIAMLDGGSIAGNAILAVVPDYNYALGLKPDYQLTGEDYRELGDKAIAEHEAVLEAATNYVSLELQSGTNLRLT